MMARTIQGEGTYASTSISSHGDPENGHGLTLSPKTSSSGHAGNGKIAEARHDGDPSGRSGVNKRKLDQGNRPCQSKRPNSTCEVSISTAGTTDVDAAQDATARELSEVESIINSSRESELLGVCLPWELGASTSDPKPATRSGLADQIDKTSFDPLHPHSSHSGHSLHRQLESRIVMHMASAVQRYQALPDVATIDRFQYLSQNIGLTPEIRTLYQQVYGREVNDGTILDNICRLSAVYNPKQGFLPRQPLADIDALTDLAAARSQLYIERNLAVIKEQILHDYIDQLSQVLQVRRMVPNSPPEDSWFRCLAQLPPHNRVCGAVNQMFVMHYKDKGASVKKWLPREKCVACKHKVRHETIQQLSPTAVQHLRQRIAMPKGLAKKGNSEFGAELCEAYAEYLDSQTETPSPSYSHWDASRRGSIQSGSSGSPLHDEPLVPFTREGASRDLLNQHVRSDLQPNSTLPPRDDSSSDLGARRRSSAGPNKTALPARLASIGGLAMPNLAGQGSVASPMLQRVSSNVQTGYPGRVRSKDDDDILLGSNPAVQSGPGGHGSVQSADGEQTDPMAPTTVHVEDDFEAVLRDSLYRDLFDDGELLEPV